MSTIVIEHKEDRRTGAVITIVFHAILVFLFMYFGLKQPVPLPEEEGIELAMADYGTTDAGQGDTETPDPGSDQANAAPTSDNSPDTPEDVATEEESEVEQVKPPDPKPTPKPDPKPRPKPDKPKEPTLDNRLANALNSWGQGGGNPGEGDSQQPGNQGVPTGVNDGIGSFHGKGFDGHLGGRGLSKGPSFTDRPEESGKVALHIFVDRQGNVVRVVQNLDKSTTTSQVLFNMARKAALQCKFSAKPDAPAEQKGEMIFTFVLE